MLTCLFCTCQKKRNKEIIKEIRNLKVHFGKIGNLASIVALSWLAQLAI